MAKPTIKVKRGYDTQIRNRGGKTQIIDDMKASLEPMQFPVAFNSAFEIYSENLSRKVRDPRNVVRPAAQMAVSTEQLIAYLQGSDAVIITVGQDDSSNFKLALQKMNINSRGSVTLESTALSNYKESTPTFPVAGVPTP